PTPPVSHIIHRRLEFINAIPFPLIRQPPISAQGAILLGSNLAMGPAKESMDYDSPDWASHAKSAAESPSSPISRADDSVIIPEKRSDVRKKTFISMSESRSTGGRDRK